MRSYSYRAHSTTPHTSMSPTSAMQLGGSTGGFPAGAIVAIVLSCAAVVVVFVALLVYAYVQKRRGQSSQHVELTESS
jgi:hypothetical protein